MLKNFYIFFIFPILINFHISKANFEDNRCRCICPSTEFFRSNNTTPNENYRRYYTKTNVTSLNCNTQTVVKDAVKKIVDENRLDAFLANCNCKFESRNSLLLRNVVLFIICVILGLSGYMLYLIVVEPIFRRPVEFVTYRRQEDDVGFSNTYWFRVKYSDSDSETIDENIFNQNISTSASFDNLSVSSNIVDLPIDNNGMQMRTRIGFGSSLNKIEIEKNRWSIEEPKQKHMLDQIILN